MSGFIEKSNSASAMAAVQLTLRAAGRSSFETLAIGARDVRALVDCLPEASGARHRIGRALAECDRRGGSHCAISPDDCRALVDATKAAA